MSVVNCKVKFIRPKYQNLREWMDDPDNVYIGRAGVVFIDGERFPKKASVFANPFKVGKHGTREEVIAKYEDYIRGKLDTIRDDFTNLGGKNLGCWCHPEPCHGDVLLRLLEE